MKASETSLRNLLEGGKQFQIPLFQRPYSWKEENWETLWEDLMSLYNDEVKGSYFLGPIVTQALPGTADGISPYIVIDGQQRLTTFSIILAVLKNYLKKIDLQIADQVYEFYLINKYQSNDDIYKVLPTQDDREVYKSIIQSKKIKDIKKEGQIYKAYRFFEDKFKNPIPDENITLDCTKFKSILLERLTLVNITTDDRDNPYLIFESLNSKREELSQADLVRNYIFMQLPSPEREEVYTDEWLPLQESFKAKMENKKYADELTKSFWFYLRKDGEAVNQKEVYKALKRRFDNCKKDYDNSTSAIKAELQKLIKFATYYQRLNFYEQEPEPKLRRWFKRLMRLDFTTCHIFLLNIYYEYEEERLSLEKFEEILRYLESYFVRRLFAGVSTKSLGIVFNTLYNEVKEANSNDLVEGLRTVLKSYDKTKVWPNDDAFCQGIISENVYTKSLSDRTKLFLESIEVSLSKERVNPENLTVEHVMPQTLTHGWKTTLGANYTTSHKKWLHTLGNLTLTGYNSELSNKPFEEKLKYFRYSNITLNQYFQNIDMWNEEAIKSRAEKLAEIAIKVWPR
jgi:uncharacterized protein with ParB-like and HNH nuclease domain